MFTIIGGRGIGKTKMLLERADSDGGTVVCREPEIMRSRAHKYGITGLNIISYDDLYNSVDYLEKPIYIHDMNKFVTHRFPNVEGYTVCNE